MGKDTITLVLGGDIPLQIFAQAMSSFNALVHQLSIEVVGLDEIEWDISSLEGGSTMTSARGIADRPADIERVVSAYRIVGRCLAERIPIPYSDDVAVPARAITSVLNGKVTSVRFVTEDHTSSITEPVIEAEEESFEKYSLGVVTGSVDTISLRGKLSFTVYDDLFDRAVSCSPDREQMETVRDAWGKRVSVIGWVHRDENTGRPTHVKRIEQVIILQDYPKGSYKKARGALPPGDELPEVTIRRLRDAN